MQTKKQKQEAEEEEKPKKKDQPGFDGRWYTDINSTDRYTIFPNGITGNTKKKFDTVLSL